MSESMKKTKSYALKVSKPQIVAKLPEESTQGEGIQVETEEEER